MLINENMDIFNELMITAVSTLRFTYVQLKCWETLLLSKGLFEANSKKQVLMFQLLSLLHARKTKFKTGLKANYTA